MTSIPLFLCILSMTLLGSLGGFFFKKCTAGNTAGMVLTSGFLYLGIAFYTAGALVNIFVLKYLPYSVVLPLTAVTYVWTMVLSRLYLKEKITANKLIGVASIIAGAVLIGVS